MVRGGTETGASRPVIVDTSGGRGTLFISVSGAVRLLTQAGLKRGLASLVLEKGGFLDNTVARVPGRPPRKRAHQLIPLAPLLELYPELRKFLPDELLEKLSEELPGDKTFRLF